MSKIYNAWKEIMAWLAAPVCPPDALAALSPRDWADLPSYHPLRDVGNCGGNG
jgi:hypothetical protein